jgi:catechol 2,3-dioxygenase-like lactoylglutathione lyase family enzyme
MPGFRGAEHFGLTVPDLDEASRFFEEVIGCQVLFVAGSAADETGNWMAEHINVHPRARNLEYRYVRCGNGTNLEIFQYSAPDQKTELPRNSDIGGHHIAFYVDDIAAAMAHLRRHGIRILAEPTVVTEGPTAGLTWVYFLAPWGLQLELVSWEKGIAHDRGGGILLWNPRTPAERLIDTG